MTLYDRYLLPRLIHLAMRDKRATERRMALIPQAQGAVLEIGIGSGLNLPFYTPAVKRLYGIDPSKTLLAMARKRARKAPFPVILLAQSAERLPLMDASIDTVVSTWTLCSIPDVDTALREMKRVLRPGGRLLFVEHGASPDPAVHAWQQRLNPIWKTFAGGCHLNRRIDQLVRAAGFGIGALEAGYLRGPRLLTYTYQGSATP